MLILKKINNNVALACSDAGDEVVVFGKGVGFPSMPYELEDTSVIEKTFVSDGGNSPDALTTVSDEVLRAASDITDLAKANLGCQMAAKLPFVMADHIQFAVDRTREGIEISNPLANEVARVYQREHELGVQGLAIIQEYTGILLPEVEASSLALHMVSSELGTSTPPRNMDELLQTAAILEGIVEVVERQVGFELDRTCYAYVRFITHTRYLIRRFKKDKPMASANLSLFQQAARDFPETYKLALAINQYLERTRNWSCSDEEMLYLMMHLNQLQPREPQPE
ncbi:PRD domain-containing protein [Paratractidigestivibacter sp.]|uniref:PRD domain-containing protein n=1 Tax=Paratractidigestivibacter sp. TaxID=2847316 RepID=UPI002ABE5285|nr:PRD domain-containing protein [Paratractidigestivibacter sp.]